MYLLDHSSCITSYVVNFRSKSEDINSVKKYEELQNKPDFDCKKCKFLFLLQNQHEQNVQFGFSEKKNCFYMFLLNFILLDLFQFFSYVEMTISYIFELNQTLLYIIFLLLFFSISFFFFSLCFLTKAKPTFHILVTAVIFVWLFV